MNYPPFYFIISLILKLWFKSSKILRKNQIMKISQISKETNIPASTIRYYENKGLIKIKRDNNNIRIFDESDIEWIKFIERLKSTGMPLKDIREYSKLRYLGECTTKERMDILLKHRSHVLNEQKKWKEYLNNLDNKIKIYKDILNEK
ncbi:transcriptional regulator, MerR family [Anaerofustis stercorihominis DSM 17244]|uniref:Transcriptional regulator, MerR family n=2 Tax=Anaerofustis stercorihominis TaxID=214853 RepID=B1C7P7_9FIRM|nr:transcriptional regulator, MerR family [Anaerofustis stercorihominis DSM 17244]